MTITVEQVDLPSAPESVLREMHRLYLVDQAEQLPGDPPVPFEQWSADWQNRPEHQDVRHWVLREDGELRAGGRVWMNRHEDLNNGFARIFVHPDARLRGFAYRLAGPVFDVLEENDRNSLITDVVDGDDIEPKLDALGLKKSLAERRSRLQMSDVDWELMEQWIARASDRATGYELVYMETPIPEEHLERWCEVIDVMNTAPRENLQVEDTHMTPKKWRDIEEKDIAAGNKLMAHAAMDRASGRFVGLSEIWVQKYHPDLAWQGDTGVHPDHRNQGLGRWLKAATIKVVAAAHPEVERVDTGNAGSNEPMLNINVEMGYRPILLVNAWQGDLAVVRERLGT